MLTALELLSQRIGSQSGSKCNSLLEFNGKRPGPGVGPNFYLPPPSVLLAGGRHPVAADGAAVP